MLPRIAARTTGASGKQWPRVRRGDRSHSCLSVFLQRQFGRSVASVTCPAVKLVACHASVVGRCGGPVCGVGRSVRPVATVRRRDNA